MHLDWALVLLLSGIAMVTDLRARRIPNWLTVPGMAAGLVLHVVLGGLAGGVQALEGLVLGFVLLLLFYTRGGMGGGDVKLLMAIGACVGPGFLFMALLYGGVFGALMSVVILVRKRMLRVALIGMATQVGRTGLKIPYAVPIFAGVFFEVIRQSLHLF